jgi:hypothetical protein
VPLDPSRQMKLFRPFRSRGPFQFEQLPKTLSVDFRGMKLAEIGSVAAKFFTCFIFHLAKTVSQSD